MPCRHFTSRLLLVLAALGTHPVDAQDLSGVLGAAANQKEATKVRDGVYFASGFGNTFLVTTSAGNVIIDTSMREIATRHQKLLRAVSDAPIRYIIVTHGHGDHAGGVKLWRQDATQVIVQRNFIDFVDYQFRLGDFSFARNSSRSSNCSARASHRCPSARPLNSWRSSSRASAVATTRGGR